MIDNQKRIEKTAREAITRASADPFLLRDLMDRLQVFHDGKLGTGDAALVVRGFDGEDPQEVLAGMSQSPEFAPYFSADMSLHPDDRERQVAKLIDTEIRAIAPAGDPLQMSPGAKLEIANEIRKAHGLPSNYEQSRSPSHHKRGVSTSNDAVFGEYASTLAMHRRQQEQARPYIEGIDPLPIPDPNGI